MADKKEEIISEVPFLPSNDKWRGTVQVLRVTATEDDGTKRVFINKRLLFTSNQRYINLPRNGWEDIVDAITVASVTERLAHEQLISELNGPRSASDPQRFKLSDKSSRRSRT